MKTTLSRNGNMAAGALAIAGVLAGCAAPLPPATTSGSVSNREPVRVAETDRYARYGYVSRIEDVPAERRTSGAGALIGGALGAVLGNQVGGGSGRTAATVVGAVGGALAGNEVEKRRETSATAAYDVHVRLDSGDSRVVTVADLGGLRIGERVRVEGNNIVRL